MLQTIFHRFKAEMNQPQILFSDSNQYFPDPQMLQSSIDFVSPLDIDIYVKKSFGFMNNQLIITGGYLECFNKDHLIDESMICYKLEGLNHLPLLQTQGYIKFNLIKQGLFSNGIIQGLIQGTPLISILVLSIMTRILPTPIATILSYISAIGLIITCLFYARKIIKVFYSMIKSKEIDYNGIGIQYENKTDILTISDEYIAMLKLLHTQANIQKIVAYQGAFYLKQQIKKTTIGESIKNIFKRIENNDNEVIQTINTTIGYILSTPFIGGQKPQN